MDEFEETKRRYEDLLPAMTAVTNRKYLPDLVKFSHNCVNLLNEISKESVVCRQRKQITARYMELIEQYKNSVNILEQYTMFAHLAGD